MSFLPHIPPVQNGEFHDDQKSKKLFGLSRFFGLGFDWVEPIKMWIWPNISEVMDFRDQLYQRGGLLKTEEILNWASARGPYTGWNQQ
jgi:hypothetical protein